MRLTHGSTFSGIGAPEVAAAMLGWENVFHCEINPFGRQVLDYYFPNAKSYEDITKTDFSEWRGKIDVLTGGFPCQPFSYAGKRGGAEDDRYLWPYMLRCIEQVRPTWFVGENVGGITTMVLPGTETQMGSHSTLFGEGDTYTRTRQRYVIEEICSNLEAIGYTVQPMLIPACAVGAPHRRDRIFFIARRNDPIVEHTDGGSNGRNAGTICGEKSTQGIQERDNIRFANNASETRPEIQLDVVGCEPNKITINVRPTTDAKCGGGGTLPVELHTGFANGNIVVGNGTGWIVTNPDHDGLQHGVDGGRETEMFGTQGERRENGVPVKNEPIASNGRGRSIADTIGGQCGTQTPCGGIETNGCGNNAIEGERGRQAERVDGCNQFLHQPGGIGVRDVPDAEPTRSFREIRGSRDSSAEWRRVWGNTPGHDSEEISARWRTFPTQSPICRGNDGIPFDVDGLTISFGRWKRETLKAYGNAIVPQVMYEIFSAIEATYD